MNDEYQKPGTPNYTNQVRREFLKRFPDGACRICGERPNPELPQFDRAMWYATHSDIAE